MSLKCSLSFEVVVEHRLTIDWCWSFFFCFYEKNGSPEKEKLKVKNLFLSFGFRKNVLKDCYKTEGRKRQREVQIKAKEDRSNRRCISCKKH